MPVSPNTVSKYLRHTSLPHYASRGFDQWINYLIQQAHADDKEEDGLLNCQPVAMDESHLTGG